MSDRESLEEQLRRLAEDLNARPSLAAGVLGEVQRRTAEAGSITLPNPTRRWIMRPVLRYAAGLAVAAALVIAVVVGARLTDIGASLAFADVQQAVREIKTAILDMEYLNQPQKNMRVLVTRDSNRGRLEWSNGLVFIMDMKQGKVLALNPEAKTAQMMPGPSDGVTPTEMLDKLTTVEKKAVGPLGKRTFDGRTLIGFKLEYHGSQKDRMEAHVWVDPKTRLPVRVESVPIDPDDPRTAPLRGIVTCTFNEPLSASLFSFTPPEGYKLLKPGPADMSTLKWPVPPAPKDPDLASLTLQPGVGIGAARFGMSAEEVIQALGKPDEMMEIRSYTPEEERRIAEAEKEAEEKKLDPFAKNRLLEKVQKSIDRSNRTPDGVGLTYASLGFRLTVYKDKGLISIMCFAGFPGLRDFTGKTTEGIGMDATPQQIEKAYGPPDNKQEHAQRKVLHLDYRSPKLTFQFKDGRLSMMATMMTSQK